MVFDEGLEEVLEDAVTSPKPPQFEAGPKCWDLYKSVWCRCSKQVEPQEQLNSKRVTY